MSGKLLRNTPGCCGSGKSWWSGCSGAACKTANSPGSSSAVPVGPYVVDFVCFTARLVIEVDGGQHAMNAADVRRDRWLATQGFRLLRFWNNEVLDNLDGVLQTIADTLADPDPLPQREREILCDATALPLSLDGRGRRAKASG